MKRQRAEISSNVISHIKSAHPIEMWRSNKLGIKEKISRGNFPRLIFSCPVPSGLPHRSHCVPMNMNPLIWAVFALYLRFLKRKGLCSVFELFRKPYTKTHTDKEKPPFWAAFCLSVGLIWRFFFPSFFLPPLTLNLADMVSFSGWLLLASCV